ncbi:MAG: serine O-acetyltransferase EpsC [Gemmatimonadaceae bacterium]
MTTIAETGWLEALGAARATFPLPRRAHVRAAAFTDQVLAFLFPHFAAEVHVTSAEVAREQAQLDLDAHVLLAAFGGDEHSEERTAEFMRALPALRDELLADARFIVESDPAATSLDEVILAYPGFEAVACHRIAHRLQMLGVALLPRLIAEYAHQRTGIDIHPGARIGVPLAIDHGTGVVIGESAELGARVRLYQGVTLGALSVEKSLASAKRHPTIEDDVVIYANATVLGGRTVVGAGSVIGGNVWITRSVPPRSVVVNKPMEERSLDDGLEFHI